MTNKEREGDGRKERIVSSKGSIIGALLLFHIRTLS